MKKISVLSVLSILFCLSSYGQQNNFPSGYDVAAIREFRNKLLADPYRIPKGNYFVGHKKTNKTICSKQIKLKFSSYKYVFSS